MSLSIIALILGLIGLFFSVYGFIYPLRIYSFLQKFPRNEVMGKVLACICCILAARESFLMNMAGLNSYKFLIYFISPIVFACSIIYLKELLAPRALGGIYCLLAVPVVKTAALSDAPFFQIVSFIGYVWVIYGITLLMAPWYFRKINELFCVNGRFSKKVWFIKGASGLFLIYLSLFVY